MAGHLLYSFGIAKSRIQHGFLLAAVLGAIGVWALFLADPGTTGGPLLGLVNLCLAASVALYNWRQLRDRQPRLVIDDIGVWYRDWDLDPVRWQDIADHLQMGGRLQAFFCLRLRDPDGFLSRLPPDRRAKMDKNPLIQAPLLKIPAHSVDADFSTIREAVDDGLARARSLS
jgi:hypothetical protein